MVRSLASMVAPAFNAVTRRWAEKQLPRLDRLRQSPHFQDLDSAATSWIDENFRQIEDAARWLIPAGRAVLDACMTGTSPQGVMHRGIFSVTGRRSVTAVYGFDGSRGDQLGQLGQVLTRLGWQDSAVRAAARSRPAGASVSLTGKTPPVRGIWKAPERPPNALDNPAPGRMNPGVRPATSGARLDVGWAARAELIEPVASLITLGQHLDQATDLYCPIHVERCRADEVITSVLDSYRNVIAVRMTLIYYHRGGIKWGASRASD